MNWYKKSITLKPSVDETELEDKEKKTDIINYSTINRGGYSVGDRIIAREDSSGNNLFFGKILGFADNYSTTSQRDRKLEVLVLGSRHISLSPQERLFSFNELTKEEIRESTIKIEIFYPIKMRIEKVEKLKKDVAFIFMNRYRTLENRGALSSEPWKLEDSSKYTEKGKRIETTNIRLKMYISDIYLLFNGFQNQLQTMNNSIDRLNFIERERGNIENLRSPLLQIYV